MSSSKATFLDYTMGQLILPMDYSELIPDDHVVRVVNEMVDLMEDELLFSAYKGGGWPPYHPKMILYAPTHKKSIHAGTSPNHFVNTCP